MIALVKREQSYKVTDNLQLIFFRVVIYFMDSIIFFIPEKAVPKGRPRFSRYGHCFTPKTTTIFERTVSKHAQAAMRIYKDTPNFKLTGRLECTITILIEKPKKPSNPYPRGDLDNMVKSILDGMNGIVFDDDSSICKINCSKEYSQHSVIYVTVAQLGT